MSPRKINIGDSITFKAATRHSNRVATRKVTGVDHLGRPLVIYNGWRDFVVMWPEISEIVRASK